MKKFLTLVLFLLSSSIAYAWTEPTLAPPNGNVLAPLRNPVTSLTITPAGASGISIGVDTGASANSGRLFFSNSTSGFALMNAGDLLAFRYGAVAGSNSGTPGLIMGNSGNVLIGNATPDSKFQVNIDSTREVRVKTAASTGLTDFSTAGSAITFSRASDGADDIAGIFNYQNSGATNRLALATRDDLVLAVGGASGYSAAPERMRIVGSNGYVGIGTANPGSALHVGAGGTMTIPNGSGTTFTPQIANSQTSGVAGISTAVNDGTNNRRIGLFVDNSAGLVGISSTFSSGAPSFVYRDGSAERLRINASGNVGIGTTSPTYKLDVTGDVNVTGCFRVAGTCISTGGGTVGGTGTVNNLSKWTAASTLGNSWLSEMADGSVRNTNANGYAEFGPKNASYNHIYTDRPATIFNTGIWAISGIFSAYSTDNLRLQTNGTDRITVLATNGNVGIGVTNPGKKLEVVTEIVSRASSGVGGVASSFTSDSFGTNIWTNAAYDPATPGSGWSRGVTITPTGNTGLGTTAPTQRLTVNGNINKLGSWIIGDVNWPGSLEVHSSAWNGSSNPNYGGVIGSKLYAYNGLQSGGASGGEATDGQLYVAGTSMLMGNVGVGTIAPQAQLDIQGTSAVLNLKDTDASAGVKNIRFRNEADHFYLEEVNDAYTTAKPIIHITPYTVAPSGPRTFRIEDAPLLVYNNSTFSSTYITDNDISANGLFINKNAVTSGSIVYGILSQSTLGHGVYGRTTGDDGINPSAGVLGETTIVGTSYGVYGRGNNAGSIGVYARNVNSVGSDFGLYCEVASASGRCGGNRAWTNTSDIRLKKNIETITSGLEKVLKLRGVTYQWKQDIGSKKNVGFIAQEVKDVLPEVVSQGSDGFYSINESSISAVLVEAIKELKAENDGLKARIEKLEAKIK